MATITGATVLYSNLEKLNRFGNYQLTIAVDKYACDDEVASKVKSLVVDDTDYDSLTISSKYPITIYGTDNKPLHEELGRGTKLIVKLSVDKRFSSKGTLRLEGAKVKELVPYVSKSQLVLDELDGADLPF